MFRREAPVASFVIKVLLVVALLLFAAMGTIEHSMESARRQAELRYDARNQADQLSSSLALPVWNYDRKQIDKIADTAMQDREVYGVLLRLNDVSAPGGTAVYGRVRDGQWRAIAASGEFSAGGELVEERDIVAGGETVGSLKLFVTPRFMEEELGWQLVHKVIIFIAFAVVLTASLYLVLSCTIFNPLRQIERFASEVSMGTAGAFEHRGAPFRGELESVRVSIEKTVELLAARYASLQQNKAMLSVVLNSIPQSIFWKDVESRYLGCNEPFAKLVGLARPDLIVDKTDFDLPWPREVSELYRARDRQVIESAVAMNSFIEPFHTADGRNLTVETAKVPLLNATGKVYGVLGVFEDITARIEAERRRNSQLEFEEFVARISSELVAAESSNLQPLLTRTLRDIALLFDADRVILGRTDEASGQLADHAHYCRFGPPVPHHLTLSTHYPDLWLRMRAGMNIFVPFVKDLLPHQAVDRSSFEELGVESQIAAPVLVDGHLQYLLGIATIGRRADWTDETVARIKVLAQLLATTALRCEAEEVVRTSERQFRTFIEQAPVPIILVPSPDGSPIYFNPAFTRVFGYTHDDLQKPEDWWPLIYPDEEFRAGRFVAWGKTLAKARETGDFQDTEEAEMRTKSGDVRFAQTRITAVGGYRMSFINDLTARRQAETALRLTQYAVDHNPVMVFRIDMEGRFDYANEAACRQSGHSSAELLERHLWDIARTMSAEEWPARAQILREHGSTSLESVYALKSGETIPVETRIQYVKFSGEEHFYIYANDIRSRKAAQEAEHAYTRRVQKLATELTRAEERQRRELAAVLHDEVGQNLFAATAQLLTIRKRAEAEGWAAQVDFNKTLSLLDKATRDTRELTFELCPPVLYQLGLIPALQRLADRFASMDGVAHTLVGHTGGPADLNVRGLAYQAVRELLNNAAKHSGAKNVAIRVSELDDRVHIEVRDDGAGFDASKLKPGTGGFGLFHLRERIELLGGSVSIDSMPGHGCGVHFTLPLNVMQTKE